LDSGVGALVGSGPRVGGPREGLKVGLIVVGKAVKVLDVE